MQGKQIVAYVGAQLDPKFKTPIEAEKIIKSWAPNQTAAEAKKMALHAKYENAIIQIE